jgi:hypothetical protein
VLIPGSAYRDFREAFRRGDHQAVLGTGQPVLDELGASETQRGLIPAVLLMIGASLASSERYRDATAYLERGLADLPGSAARREVGEGDWYALILLDILLLQGRYQQAWLLTQGLVEPARSLEVRLGATRAQVAVTAAYRDFTSAQQLLNTAAGLADRLRNRQSAAMVDGDRAVVLALQDRTIEAAAFADQVLPALARPGPGPALAWSAAQAVTVTTTVARHAARVGDLMTAERMLLLSFEPTAGSGRRFDRAQLDLARGVVWSESGRPADAEAPVLEARRSFLALGCAPTAALALREQAAVAASRGLHASSRPLYERARDEFAALGLMAEVAEVDAVMHR